jgi:hypothetical protein
MNRWGLGQTQRTIDPAATLQGHAGTFRVITPNKEELTVVCKPGHSIASVQMSGHNNSNVFMVTKIAEPVNDNDNNYNPGESNAER